MSLVFGGKIISSQEQPGAFDDYDDPNYGIRLLSKREKALLAELQKTRSEIVNELVTLGPSVSSDSVDDWRQTIMSYENQLSGQHHDSRMKESMGRNMSKSQPLPRKLKSISRTSSYASTELKTALDFLPAMRVSTSGALSSSSKSSNTIRLPVLNLPSIQPSDSIEFPQSQKTDALKRENVVEVLNSQQSPAQNGFTNEIYLDDLDRFFIQQYLLITNEQMNEILLHLDDILCGGTENSPSVFNAVNVNWQYSTIGALSSSVESEGSATSELYFKPSTASTRFVSDTDMLSRTSPYTHSRRSVKGSKVTANKRKRKTKMAWQKESINDVNSVEALRRELVASLGSMQHHTAEVKSGILEMKNFVSLKNMKAKTFITSMAADQLFAVLRKIVNRNLQRGFNAWKLNIKEQELALKAYLFKRFEDLRQLCRLLNRLVLKVVGAKFFEWVRYCVNMRTHEEMELKTAAVLLVQRVVRGILSRVRVKKLKNKRDLTKMHDALIKMQAIFRAKLQLWKYKSYRQSVLEEASARTLQRVVRGHLGRRKAAKTKLFQNKELNAVMIQSVIRGLLGRNRALEQRLLRLKGERALQIQIVARGYIARKRVEKIKQDKVDGDAAVNIQAIMRGALARMNMHRKRKEVENYQLQRNDFARLIQAVYRGHRARILCRYYMQEKVEMQAVQNQMAVVLQCAIRCFVARVRVRRLREERFDGWVASASQWKEMWAEDSSCWFYFNENTQEALWEPPSVGYKKSDGQLVLENGQIIDEPDFSGKKKRAPGEEHLCVECVKRVAIRSCEECGDGFCTKCFKTTHASGSRKQHSWKPAGPIDCTECEEELAERWCVTCDEAYCDECWRKVHSKGKRRFHPFSQVQEDGYIDSRIFTIDGEQVSNYNATFSQNRLEGEQNQEPALDARVQDVYNSMEIQDDVAENEYADFMEGQYQSEESYSDVEGQSVEGYAEYEEWTQYTDDDGNPYWANNYTGESQYENPYS